MAKRIPKYRIALLGDAGVGKTTLLMRLKTGKFIDTESPAFTLCGRDTVQYEMMVDNSKVAAVFRDTAGGEKFRTLTKSHFRNNDAAILVFDVESNYTLTDLRGWIEETEGSLDTSQFVWALFGNKCDLECRFDQSVLDDYRLKLDTNLSFLTSAKTGLNVKMGFDSVIAYLHRNVAKNWKRQSYLMESSFEISMQSNHDQDSHCC